MKKDYSTLTTPFFLIKNKLVHFAFGFVMLIFFTNYSLAQKTWTGGGGDGLWATATNWSGGTVPIATDQVVLDNSGVAGTFVVTLPVTAVTIVRLTITPTNPNIITLILPNTNTTVPGLLVGDVTPATDDIIINSGGELRNSSGAAIGNGIQVDLTNGILRINNGGKYIHSTARSTAGTVPFLSTVVGTETGIYEYDSPGTGSIAISASGRNYGSLTLTRTAGAAIYTSAGGTALTVRGNFTVNTGVTYNSTMTGAFNLGGNLTNIGITPLPSSQAINFNGTTVQSITNSGTLTFGATEPVTFNNAAGFTLNSNITLNNLVTFTAGVITVANPIILTLSSTASVAGVTNASYVNGLVKKVGGTAFQFPVGKPGIGYVPIGISAPPIATDDFTAEYVRSSAEALGTISAIGLDHVSRVDYWTLNRTGISIVDVTLNWTAQSSNNGSASYINNMPDLVVAHHNVTWDVFSGLGMTTGNVTAGSIVWPAVNLFGPFSLGSINFNNPLPVTFNYLNGTKQNSGNYLNWKVTCTNNPNVTMGLERSADKINFTHITTITADALRCQQPFDYTDNSPAAGLNYYRLKMTAANGKTSYSGAIAILNKATGFDFVSLMPSVVNNNAVLNITSAQKIKMDVVITDIAGKQIQKIAYNLIAGSNQFKLNLANLGAGTYQITGYTADGEPKTLRFVKQ